MASRSPLRNSNLCAVSLLDALNRPSAGDLARRLENALELGHSSAEDTEEGERIELLGGIARQIRDLAAAGNLEQAGVYIDLLRHLAAPAAFHVISIAASTQRETPSSGWN